MTFKGSPAAARAAVSIWTDTELATRKSCLISASQLAEASDVLNSSSVQNMARNSVTEGPPTRERRLGMNGLPVKVGDGE